MNWKKLLSIGALTMFSASIATGQGTAPTIVQGDYISNVFGNSNFIKNPNAKLNNANVTVSNATVTRSTATPLVATSEFLVTTSTSTGSATWSTRTFDGGMKGQNCEARFSYRGFSVGSTTAQILQGANVVAQLTLTASTDPRIASINFPCGDLSSATTFRLQQATASLTGTNEIGGIYVGLATNMANVAQAEMVGTLRNYGGNCIWTGNGTSAIAADTDCSTYSKEGLDLQPSTRVPAIAFTAPKSGNYAISASIYFGAAAQQVVQCQVYQNGVLKHNVSAIYTSAGATSNENRAYTQFNADLTGGTAYTFDLRCTASSIVIARSIEESIYWSVYRFPSSSELVVTPERQGDWWISGIFTGGLPQLGTTTNASGGFNEITNATLSFNPDSGSQPVATVCSSTNAPPALSTTATTCAAGNESLGLTFNVPSVGAYEVCTEFTHSYAIGANGTVDDSFSLQETATNNNVALTTKSSINSGTSWTIAGNTFLNTPLKICETFNFTSIGQKAVRLMYAFNHIAPINQNQLIANDSQGKRNIKFTVQQVTGKSNSALYVQGPVLGAQTGAAIPSGYLGKAEFGGSSSIATGLTGVNTTNVYTIPNVTPGVYLARMYGAGDRTGATTATYAFWTCILTTNASASVNWYSYIGAPQSFIGSSTGVYGGTHLATYASNSQLISVTSTSTYYVRCGTESNNSGMNLTAGAEFIRIN